MFRISENKLITMTRGDSGELPVILNIGTTVNPSIYHLEANDKVYLGVTEPNKPFEDGLIRKVITGSDKLGQSEVLFTFNPIDTEYVMPGDYFYSIKLMKYIDELHYSVYTIIDKRKFTIID